jgi:glutamine amidotransferase
MCELFAIDSKNPVRANGYLEEFYSHSVKHPHGWGLSWRDGSPFDEESVTLYREPKRAIDSEQLPHLLENPIEQHQLLAHIRYATGTRMRTRNCHPFREVDVTGRQWTMIHNGILFNERLTSSYDAMTEGDTDSERMAAFLLDVMDEAFMRGAKPDFDSRFAVLASALAQLANRNRINVILSDGEYTYVHTNTSKATLNYRAFTDAQGGKVTVVSTQPLGGEDERGEWKPVPPNRLIALHHGRLVRTSAPHGYKFCETILELQRAMGIRPEDFVA